MPFINTEGLTIIGDGSQWFWSMAAFFAIPITGYAIFSQLRAQRSANRVNAMKALSDEWSSERMVRHRLAVMLHHAEGKSGWPPPLAFVANFFERMAYLAKRGDVHVEDIWEHWGLAVQMSWLRDATSIAEDRKTSGSVTWRNWEKLVHVMAEIDRRRGRPPVDPGVARGMAAALFIPDLIERLRLEQEMKSGVVPTWPPAQVAEEAQA